MSDLERLDSPEAIVEYNSIEMSELKARVNSLLERAKRNHRKFEASQRNFEASQRNFEASQRNFERIAAEIEELAAENSRILDPLEGKQQDDG